jgi:hypothetical protein
VVSHLLSYIQHALARSPPLSHFFASKLLLKSHLTKLNLRPVNGPKGKNGGGNASWPACASESLCVVKYGVNGMAKTKKPTLTTHGATLLTKSLEMVLQALIHFLRPI